jgi:hypothetical protein
MLAARCARFGWNLSRETLAKIEGQYRWVSDFELICLAQVLHVDAASLLLPKDKIAKTLEDFFQRLYQE